MTGERRIVSDQPQDLHAELWAALATNAVLLGASPEARSRLLRERAELWDRLAAVSSPACGQAYRAAAAECLAESSATESSATESSGAGSSGEPVVMA